MDIFLFIPYPNSVDVDLGMDIEYSPTGICMATSENVVRAG
jgi:hypothetical protein